MSAETLATGRAAPRPYPRAPQERWMRRPPARANMAPRPLRRGRWGTADGRSMRADGDDETDAALIARMAAQDMAAFRGFYDRYQRRVHAFLRRRLSDSAEVEDVFHETMMEIWRSAARYEGRSAVAAWALRIARNKAVDALRKRRIAPSDASPDEAIAAIPDDAASAHDQLAAADEASALRRCLESLSTEKRELVEMIFMEGLRYSDAAEALGAPEGTLKARIHHAKAALRKCLQGLGVGLESASGERRR